MIARRPGTCPATGRPYAAGAEIRHTALGWTPASVTDAQVEDILARERAEAEAAGFLAQWDAGLRETNPRFRAVWAALSPAARRILEEVAIARSERSARVA